MILNKLAMLKRKLKISSTFQQESVASVFNAIANSINDDMELTDNDIYRYITNDFFDLEKKELPNKDQIHAELSSLLANSSANFKTVSQGKTTEVFKHYNTNGFNGEQYEYLVRDMIKLYIPLDIDSVQKGAPKLFDFLASNEIPNATKISNFNRSDNLIVRVNNIQDAERVIEFCKNEQIISDNLGLNNPFLPEINGIGIAKDAYGISYNKKISVLIDEYTKTNDSFSLDNFMLFIDKKIIRETDSRELFLLNVCRNNMDAIANNKNVLKLYSEKDFDVKKDKIEISDYRVEVGRPYRFFDKKTNEYVKEGTEKWSKLNAVLGYKKIVSKYGEEIANGLIGDKFEEFFDSKKDFPKILEATDNYLITHVFASYANQKYGDKRENIIEEINAEIGVFRQKFDNDFVYSYRNADGTTITHKNDINSWLKLNDSLAKQKLKTEEDLNFYYEHLKISIDSYIKTREISLPYEDDSTNVLFISSLIEKLGKDYKIDKSKVFNMISEPLFTKKKESEKQKSHSKIDKGATRPLPEIKFNVNDFRRLKYTPEDKDYFYELNTEKGKYITKENNFELWMQLNEISFMSKLSSSKMNVAYDQNGNVSFGDNFQISEFQKDSDSVTVLKGSQVKPETVTKLIDHLVDSYVNNQSFPLDQNCDENLNRLLASVVTRRIPKANGYDLSEAYAMIMSDITPQNSLRQ